MATHSSIPACQIPRMEEPGGCSPWDHNEFDTTDWAHTQNILSNKYHKVTKKNTVATYTC